VEDETDCVYFATAVLWKEGAGDSGSKFVVAIDVSLSLFFFIEKVIELPV
jgi:hypothetical protein